MTECVFCRIVAGTEHAMIVREWSEAVAFVPHDPVEGGHLLVVPREHVRDAVDRPFVTAMTMAHAAELAADYSSSNILTNVGAPAGQSVFHLHFHVIPRFAGDQLMVPWGTTGNPHDPHWCKAAERLSVEVARLEGQHDHH